MGGVFFAQYGVTRSSIAVHSRFCDGTYIPVVPLQLLWF
jgi:hypothetical protein